ncbi:MAG: DNA-deoxyinosine glycosylase [Clostridia bacterium]|nr:DNA-deoxyinosine glycosylase [Clostridia bacterium]
MPIIHPFGPLYDANSKILILGSFPSVKSREANFFYGHPQNRFWKVMANILNCDTPQTIYEKKNMLLMHSIALWDSLASCDIVGSADSTIKNPVANDLSPIFDEANIRLLCFNGKKSEEIYKKYSKTKYDVDMCCLPSTSPANAAFSFERLSDSWKEVILPVLKLN